jgi:hypothetical protein
MHFAQKKSGAKEDSMDEMNGAPLVRHHVSGDFFKESKDGRKLVDKKYVELFKKWHGRGVQKWTNAWVYTHGAEQLERAGHGAESWPENVQVLASCDSKEDAKALQGKGWRTARVTEELDDLEPGEVYCPYDKVKVTGKGKPITCHVCRLCVHDGPNIVFLKH